MIIPDYNKRAVNVHLKFENEMDNEALTSKAFTTMTGLKSNCSGCFLAGELDIAIICANDPDEGCAVCTNREGVGDVDILASVMVKDKASKDVIITFHKAIFQASTCDDDFEIPMIDFLFKYKNELFTNKSDVIL